MRVIGTELLLSVAGRHPHPAGHHRPARARRRRRAGRHRLQDGPGAGHRVRAGPAGGRALLRLPVRAGPRAGARRGSSCCTSASHSPSPPSLPSSPSGACGSGPRRSGRRSSGPASRRTSGPSPGGCATTAPTRPTARPGAVTRRWPPRSPRPSRPTARPVRPAWPLRRLMPPVTVVPATRSAPAQGRAEARGERPSPARAHGIAAGRRHRRQGGRLLRPPDPGPARARPALLRRLGPRRPRHHLAGAGRDPRSAVAASIGRPWSGPRPASGIESALVNGPVKWLFRRERPGPGRRAAAPAAPAPDQQLPERPRHLGLLRRRPAERRRPCLRPLYYGVATDRGVEPGLRRHPPRLRRGRRHRHRRRPRRGGSAGVPAPASVRAVAIDQRGIRSDPRPVDTECDRTFLRHHLGLPLPVRPQRQRARRRRARRPGAAGT